MEYHCVPDVLPIDHSEGASGSGPYRRLYELPVIHQNRIAALDADYCRHGTFLRRRTLEQLLQCHDLSE